MIVHSGGGGGAACCTVKVEMPEADVILMTAERATPVFAWTLHPTAPAPVPELVVSAIQVGMGASNAAVHTQFAWLIVTGVEPVPTVDDCGTISPSAGAMTVQGGASCWTVNVEEVAPQLTRMLALRAAPVFSCARHPIDPLPVPVVCVSVNHPGAGATNSADQVQ